MALVGPVSPFRGGIAQYTTRLHHALSPRCALATYSFRRQYPAWLYPGASDREPGATDLEGVAYSLDALDPTSWLRTARRIADEGAELAVLSWWTLYWAPAFALIARGLRRRGVKVAMLCHNLFDHDSGRLRQQLTARMLGQADAFLVHTTEQAQTLRRLFPAKTVLRHPHPVYDQFPAPAAPLPKRGRLELLFFGFIRPYKGLEALIDALGLLADPEVHLTVIGEPWGDPEALRERVRRSGAPNVELHLRYVDEAMAANHFARADLLVLPYHSASGSGVAAIAQHYGCPILATRVGGLAEIVDEGRTGFLIDPGQPAQWAERLRQMDRGQLARMSATVRADTARSSWSSLAQTLLSLAAGDDAAEVAHAAP